MVARREDITSVIRVRRGVLTPRGDVVELRSGLGAAGPALDALVASRDRSLPVAPKGETGKQLFAWGWTAPEPGADPGHIRFLPAGALVFALVRDWLETWVAERLGGAQIRTPTVYRWSNSPAPFRDLLATFEDRLYFAGGRGDPGSQFLRFAGDPGVLSMLQGTTLADRNLPLRLYESVDAFRRNRSGEHRQMKRTRSFHLIDHHAFCRDVEQAEDEFVAVLAEQLELHRSLGMDAAVDLTVTEAVLSDKRALLGRITELAGPIALEVLEGPRHYWQLKHVLYTDVAERTLNTQLDTDNGERFAVSGPDGRPCPILHSTTGTVERWMLVLVGHGSRREVPSLPLWMAPTQVRLLPVTGDDFSAAVSAARALEVAGVRADVDDRARSVAARIRQAEREWLPFVAVLGPAERRTGMLAVRERGAGVRNLDGRQLAERLSGAVAARPALRRAPRLLLSGDPFAVFAT